MIKNLVVLLCLLCFSTPLKANETAAQENIVSETAEVANIKNNAISADSAKTDYNSTDTCTSENCLMQNESKQDDLNSKDKENVQLSDEEKMKIVTSLIEAVSGDSYSVTEVLEPQPDEDISSFGGVEVHIGFSTRGDIEYKKITPEEDVFYTGGDVLPIEDNATGAEELFRNDSLVDDSELKPQPLPCDSLKLKKQIKKFVYNHIKDSDENSVIEKRGKILLVQNLHDFKQIAEEDFDSSQDYLTAAVLANLKINQRVKIGKICLSSDNSSDKFKNIYAIIYPYLNYYKVIIPSIMTSQEKIDEATFIFNW